jgi:outer membrane protein
MTLRVSFPVVRLVALSALLPGGAGPCLRAADEQTLTLGAAFEAVQDANFTALLSREAVIQAIAAAQQQRASLLPAVQLGAEQQRSRAVSVSDAGILAGTPGDRFDARLRGTLALLDPVEFANYRAAQTAVRVAELDHQQTLQTVLNQVTQTYFTHLRNLKRFEVIEANIARARVLLDLSRNQLNAGVATQIDVTRAESTLATAEQSRLQQQTVVYQSELDLKHLLGLEPDRRLPLDEFNARPVAAAVEVASEENAAFAARADYLAAQRRLEQQRLALRAAKSERWPVLSAFGEYGIASERAFDGRGENAWAAGVTLAVPIFEGFRLNADQRMAGSRVRAVELRLRELELFIRAELRLAVQDASSRFAQIAVAGKARALAEEELRLARVRFEQGVADNREIVDAQNSLAVASDNLVEAVYQYNLSRLQLARVRGDVRQILQERAE